MMNFEEISKINQEQQTKKISEVVKMLETLFMFILQRNITFYPECCVATIQVKVIDRYVKATSVTSEILEICMQPREWDSRVCDRSNLKWSLDFPCSASRPEDISSYDVVPSFLNLLINNGFRIHTFPDCKYHDNELTGFDWRALDQEMRERMKKINYDNGNIDLVKKLHVNVYLRK